MSKVTQVDTKEFKNMSKDERGKYIRKLRDRDAEMVTGVFQNLENRGGGIQFNYSFYPGEEFKYYEFYDGERCTIPRGVARHLNNNCYYTEYAHLKGQFGAEGTRVAGHKGRLKAEDMRMKKKVHRFSFSSLDFMDDDIGLFQSNIVEVEANI